MSDLTRDIEINLDNLLTSVMQINQILQTSLLSNRPLNGQSVYKGELPKFQERYFVLFERQDSPSGDMSSLFQLGPRVVSQTLGD